ncbi:FecR domain-containing protein [uncultured Kriegella sp.]|uniref:FecR family protein n=1 Tax=uncultured Kriegella sp. TaxID=1798910 RepID=UPI0030DBB4EE|tara:strand:+ start:41912 stop:43105 length:1194 start_codon:yes stop_codon:yes gene_type:complete
MENDTLEYLVRDYFDGKIDDIQMFELIKDYPFEEVKKHFINAMEIDFLLFKKYSNINSQQAFEDFLVEIKSKEKKKKKVRHNYHKIWFKYAALFVGFIGLGLVFTVLQKSNATEATLQISDEAANLYLTDGTVEKLKESESSNILDSDGQVIAVQTHEKIVYRPVKEVESLKYNELKVPYGKKFELEFSDGTLVFLNSGSSIRYPIHFVKNEPREVILKGEAFFKVSKDEARPFVVNTGAVDVKVLGTEFNVSAYSEDDHISTVLVSGSVQLYDSMGPNDEMGQVKLLPGKRGVWRKGDKDFKVDDVDTSIYTSWVQDKLIFRNTPFSEMRKKLERHYNVSIINSNEALDKNTFNAYFSDESIEEILEILDRTYGIEYKIEDNQIIIKYSKAPMDKK